MQEDEDFMEEMEAEDSVEDESNDELPGANEEPPEGPQDVGGFTVLGDFKPKEKKQVARVLPAWLRWPTVIPESCESQFDQIPGLDSALISQLKAKGLDQCFPVQWTVIPELLAQCRCGLYAGDAGFRPRDICVSAPTGSGKTLTFALPIIQALRDRVVPHVRALVVLPVRDLAVQVYKVFEDFSQASGLKVVLLSGKKEFSQEQKSLVMKRLSVNGQAVWSSMADIVVATRGRLLDHIENTQGFDLSHLRFLVIDEADNQMEALHSDWLEQIEAAVYATKANVAWPYAHKPPGPLTVARSRDTRIYPQKLLFSATLSQNPELLERLNLFLPLLFTTTPAERSHQDSNSPPLDGTPVAGDRPALLDKPDGDKYSTPATLHENFLDCKTSEKALLLLHFLVHKQFTQVLCFTNTVEAAHRLYLLTRQVESIKVAELSSNVHSVKRERIIRQFSRGDLHLLVCSDVMARGIDIENVQYVVSYDAPAQIETYIHRVGRTARAHKSGTAITFLEGKEMFHFKKMLRESGRWPKMKRIHVNRSLLQPLLPQFTQALKALPDILKEQRRKKKEM